MIHFFFSFLTALLLILFYSCSNIQIEQERNNTR